ncbi:Acetyltransferase ataH [Psilocybe cubensis]|uniref:Acetyltransferase ataH n=1 Tax=Psilocybe cubensis TaxID=181762 RepID=A0ACB8GWA0_PSICU|nr:Acetyltransferase ataH [Psilocybe cubensis]KAH9479901.1 Acetyltransferase ataH [Psilocybe cubensis]
MNWANDLISNTRGVNWNYEAPALRRSSKSRWGFVIDNILKTICLYLVWDIISYVMRHNPAFHRDNNEPMGAHGFLWQIWNAMGYWTALYCFIRLNHTLSSALIVMVGEGEPKDYPDMTGPLSETTTVRKFWGRTWHQSLRRMVSAHGKHFANVFLGYPKGTLMSAYLQLFVAFLVSGIIHGTADFVAIRNVTSFYRNILFFTLQAAAIAFEDGMIFLGKRMKLERVPKALGYAWVVAWLALSGPIWLETLITGRLLLQNVLKQVRDWVKQHGKKRLREWVPIAYLYERLGTSSVHRFDDNSILDRYDISRSMQYVPFELVSNVSTYSVPSDPRSECGNLSHHDFEAMTKYQADRMMSLLTYLYHSRKPAWVRATYVTPRNNFNLEPLFLNSDDPFSPARLRYSIRRGIPPIFHVTPDDFIPSLSLSDIEKIDALLRIKHSDKIPPEEVKQAVMGGKDVVKPLVESKMFKGKNPRKCSFCSVVKDKDLLVCSRV